MPGLRTQPSLKMTAVATVLLAHAGGLAVAARSLGSAADIHIGGAPVINVTLERAPRLDSKPMPRAEPSKSTALPEFAPSPLQRRRSAPTQEPTAVLEIAQPTRIPAALPAQTAPPLRTIPVSLAGAGSAQAPPRQAADMTSGGGAATLGDAALRQEDAYAAAVMAWIERHKGRPRDQLRGAVTLRFELDRQGRVRRAEIIQQAEDARIGARAIDALRAAPPFPRPPVGTAWTRREFTVRLDYRSTALS